MKDKYNPEVGEIWWSLPDKKHVLFLSKQEPPDEFSSYKWNYEVLCLENGKITYLLHRYMNAHGEGWFKRVA